MNDNGRRFNALFSLKTQLVLGAVVLLALTAGSISYSLLVHQKRILEREIEKTIVYQGRNIALGSQTALLRSDPEFELFPRVKRILSRSESITSVVITDSEGLIQGDEDLTNLSTHYNMDLSNHTSRQSSLLVEGELLYDASDSFFFRTPVKSLGKEIGHVHLRYSKIDLQLSTQRAITITLFCGAIAFSLGIVLALLLFRRISRPIDDLVRGAERIGSGDLDTRVTVHTRNEFGVLANSINEMAASISKAQTELVTKERMAKELEIARDIQSTLVPSESFKTEGFEISFYYKPALEVSGDYVDAFCIDERNIAMIMGDVSGKGVPGLVVMAMLKVMVRDLIYQGLSPKEVVRKLNISLAENLKPKMFVTLFIAYLNLDTSELTYSNAGHNPLMIYSSRDRKCTLHKLDGPPLGVFPDGPFSSLLSEYRLVIEPGDLAFQYTDGLSESANVDDEQFGLDNIQQFCERFAEHGAMACVQQAIVSEEAFRGGAPQQDDITLLALSCAQTTSDGDTTAASEPASLAGNLNMLVHSVDFDESTVRLDVVAPISDRQHDVLKRLVTFCHHNHFDNVSIRCEPSLLENMRSLLRDIPASDPLVTISELRREKQQKVDDALYRLRASGTDRTTTVEYAISLSDFQSALNRINLVLRIVGSSIPLDERCLTRLEFCVHELVANSVEHAAFTTHKPAIEIAFVVRKDAVDVTYRDNAEPFHPSNRLEVDISHKIMDGKKRGLGIHLIRQLTEELKHERENEWNNTTFRITRELELQEA